MRNGFVPPVRLRHTRRLGKLAWSALAAGSRGRVLAATSSAIYLASANHDLLWLATEHAPLHRRGIQVAGPLPQAAPGSAYAVVGRRLDLGPRLAFDLSGASVWDVAPARLERVVPLASLPAHLATAFALLARLPSPAGFGLLLPAILGCIDNPLSPCLITESAPALKHAWPAIRRICEACRADELPAVLACAEELVGLGEGLTPSGDDFVGGLLYSLHRLRDVHTSLGRLEIRDLNLFLSRAKPRTNLISYTLLRDHTSGHASDALHQLVDALLTGQTFERIEPLATRLIRVGHSTGWDLLTGVVVGMMSTCRVLATRLPSEVGAARFLLS
jgi:hypothetical protein